MILWTNKINILWINIYIANILYIIYIYYIIYIIYNYIYILYTIIYIYYIQLYIILYTNILYILQIYLLQININDLKSTWKGIKNLISLKELPNVALSNIFDNGRSLTDPQEIANALNKYFANVALDI